MLKLPDFFLCLALLCQAGPAPVTVTIDAARAYQTIEGFGATMYSPFEGSERTLTQVHQSTANF